MASTNVFEVVLRRQAVKWDAFWTLSEQRVPQAIIRAIVVTNPPIGTKLKSVVYATLGDEASEFVAPKGYKILPLQTIGAWVGDRSEEHTSELQSTCNL